MKLCLRLRLDSPPPLCFGPGPIYRRPIILVSFAFPSIQFCDAFPPLCFSSQDSDKALSHEVLSIFMNHLLSAALLEQPLIYPQLLCPSPLFSHHSQNPMFFIFLSHFKKPLPMGSSLWLPQELPPFRWVNVTCSSVFFQTLSSQSLKRAQLLLNLFYYNILWGDLSFFTTKVTNSITVTRNSTLSLLPTPKSLLDNIATQW